MIQQGKLAAAEVAVHSVCIVTLMNMVYQMKRVTIIKPKTRYARHSISVEPVPLKNAML